jgi:hypothetical protein
MAHVGVFANVEHNFLDRSTSTIEETPLWPEIATLNVHTFAPINMSDESGGSLLK